MSMEVTEFRFEDAHVRFIEEADAPAIARLFQLNYGDGYVDPEVYDGTWVKRCIYNDDIICLVIEEEGELRAAGALLLDRGDYNDQVAEMGRFVVSPEHKGRGLGRRLNKALLETVGETVDFLFGTARTTHTYIQSLSERCQFTAAGLLPHYYQLNDKRESFVYYLHLTDNGRELRSHDDPRIIPPAVPLARHVLSAMKLPTSINIAEECEPYPEDVIFAIHPLKGAAFGKLARIEHGRLVEPLLFGNVSLEQGILYIRRRNTKYLMAVDESGNPVGAIGYHLDAKNSIVRGVELIGKGEHVRGYLCGEFIREAERLGAKGIEVNLSAYDARLQRTFYEYGFRPVVYAPAMVFHATCRLDVIKMLKLNVPFDLSEMRLTEEARTVASIIERA